MTSANKYCSLASLKNESDVEQFFVLPLLSDLGYTSDYLETKASIQKEMIGKGKKRKQYFPDYLAYTLKGKQKPVLIIDAKHPDKDVEEGVEDSQLYASVIRCHGAVKTGHSGAGQKRPSVGGQKITQLVFPVKVSSAFLLCSSLRLCMR